MHLTVLVKFINYAGAYISIYPPEEYDALDSIESYRYVAVSTVKFPIVKFTLRVPT